LNVPRRTEESGSERNGLGGEAPLCHLWPLWDLEGSSTFKIQLQTNRSASLGSGGKMHKTCLARGLAHSTSPDVILVTFTSSFKLAPMVQKMDTHWRQETLYISETQDPSTTILFGLFNIKTVNAYKKKHWNFFLSIKFRGHAFQKTSEG
jgi:hypothetical protein